MALSGDLSYKRQGRHIEPSGTLGNAICRYKAKSMRWLKHLSTAQRDPDMQALISEFGYEGYGVYWSILETIAEHLDGNNRTDLALPIKSWKIPAISDRKWMKIVHFLKNNDKFLVEIKPNSVLINCPKLLKYRDEYQKRKERNS